MRYQFVDCRFDLFDMDAGERLYRDGHIPGASFLDLDRDLSDTSRAPAEGRHPLPTAESFAASASAAGIGPGVLVVAYDDGTCGGAARLWWLLRHFGHDETAVLDGGIGSWNGPLASGLESIAPGHFRARPRSNDVVDAAELLARLDDPDLMVVDARARSRYRGAGSADDPIAALDPIAGHVPGAVNAPHEHELPAGLLDAEELAVYCGSGVTACVQLLRLARAGRDDARLYPGSWSEWSRRGLPAAHADDDGAHAGSER